MSRVSRVRAGLAPALVSLLLAGCGGGPGGHGTLKVGLVFDVGGRGDKSFNDAAYRGLERAKKELGIEYEYIEPGEGADRESALRKLASKGADVIFGVGFMFTDDVNQVSRDFPNQKFACIDYALKPGEQLPPNMVALKFKEEEGSCLVGAIAGLLTKTRTVGFIGGMKIPLIKKFEAGYQAGVRMVNPKAQVLVGYAGVTGEAFKNPGKGKELALSQFGQGADIIFHASGSTGLGLFEAAREKGKLAIGVDSDQYGEAPGVVLTSMVKRVDVAVLETIRSVLEKRFKPGVKEFGLASDGVGYVFDDRNHTLIPASVIERVEAIKKDIVAGKVKVPST